MPVPLSILDQSPIVAGSSPRAAIEATIALARYAEALGYHRYWLAEHHSVPSLANASPEVLLARLTAETSTIRLGTGGIMLPHYSAFKVAETFRMLDALAPSRVDLGVGRAPGGAPHVSLALRSSDPEIFPEQIEDVLSYLEGAVAEPRRRGLTAQPAGETKPAVWVLGSTDFGTRIAAGLGLPFSFAHFIGGDYPEVTRGYRSMFQASRYSSAPYVMLTVATIVAPTDEEAERLSLPVCLQRLRRLRGISSDLPTLDEAVTYAWTELERQEVRQSRNMIVGSPATVCAQLGELVASYQADEIMAVTVTPDAATRTRSYDLLINAWRGRTGSSR